MWRNLKLRNDEEIAKRSPGFFQRFKRAVLIGLGIGLLFKLLLIQFIRVTH